MYEIENHVLARPVRLRTKSRLIGSTGTTTDGSTLTDSSWYQYYQRHRREKQTSIYPAATTITIDDSINPENNNQPDEVHDMTFIVIRDSENKSFDGKDYDDEAKAVKAAEKYARVHDDYFYVYKPVKVAGPIEPKVTTEAVEL